MQSGAADYLTKGSLTADLLEHSIRYSINRRHTEEALRESEARYRAIVEDQTELIQRDPTSKGIPGMGLGLAIVKEIAERHRGKVWVDPGLERGVKFVLAIPKGL